MLIPWQQANVVIDQEGRARLTEYGLAVISSDPRFAVPVAPGVTGTSRWLAPEIIDPSDNGDGISVVESKPADVFAFAMLAVEVFTGEVPFEGQTSAMAASRVLRGERPEMPGNAQDVGLTGEMWKLLESCWQQDPEKRPTMDEVVRKWEKFVECNDNTITGYVQITRPIGTSSSIPFSTFYDRLRKTRPAAGPALSGVPRTQSEATLRTKQGGTRVPTRSESVQPRTQLPATRPGEPVFPKGTDPKY